MFFQILDIFSNLGGALSQSVTRNKLATLNNYPADNAGRAKGAKIWHCHARDDGGKHPNLQLLFPGTAYCQKFVGTDGDFFNP